MLKFGISPCRCLNARQSTSLVLKCCFHNAHTRVFTDCELQGCQTLDGLPFRDEMSGFFFQPNAPQFPEEHFYSWKVPRLLPIVLVDEDEYGALVEWYWEGKTEVREEKHIPVPLCPSHISRGLTLDRTRPSTMTNHLSHEHLKVRINGNFI